MWRLGTFRERLINVCKNHRCNRSSSATASSAIADNAASAASESGKKNTSAESGCLLCALQNLFINYKFSNSRIIPPEIVRKALAITSEAFPMFEIGDACEAFEVMPKYINPRVILL